MANHKQTFNTLLFHNQMIDGQLVDSVRVRIFKANNRVASTSRMTLVATDSSTVQKYPDSSLTYTSHYSYVILSSGICEECSSNEENPPLYLHIKVILTDNFNVSMLDDKDFLGKACVLEALQEKTELKPVLSPILKYLQEKVGDNYYEELYKHLKFAALSCNFQKVEELFQEHKISDKHQSLFWKEMYKEAINQK